jgi:mannose/fructose/N-acetylgalactosamine-specific phosphotransferase system component IIB
MISILNVDDRLLHGQVAFYWTEKLFLEKILICNDEAAGDEFTKMVLGLAKPHHLILEIFDLKHADEYVKPEFSSEAHCALITGNLQDALHLIQQYPSLSRVNIIGLRERIGSKAFNEHISFTVEDLLSIKKMLQTGIEVTAQYAPDEGVVVVTEEVLVGVE